MLALITSHTAAPEQWLHLVLCQPERVSTSARSPALATAQVIVEGQQLVLPQEARSCLWSKGSRRAVKVCLHVACRVTAVGPQFFSGMQSPSSEAHVNTMRPCSAWRMESMCSCERNQGPCARCQGLLYPWDSLNAQMHRNLRSGQGGLDMPMSADHGPQSIG